MNEDGDELNEGGYKGLKFIIKNVTFKVLNPILFFPVNCKGKREGVDIIGYRFLLYFPF